LRMIGHGKRVLEFGCAGGHVTKALAERSCRVTGVEISAEAAKEAAPYAEEIIVGDLEGNDLWSKLSGDRYDVLLFGDVLEHLRDPLAALLQAKSVLARDGFVVISVPNVAHGDVRIALLNGEFNYTPTGLLDSTHAHLFTYKSMLELLHRAGLSPVEVHRVRRPMFSTEVAVDPTGVSAAVIERLRSDPEAETYQFVSKSVLDNGDLALRQSMVRLREADDLVAAGKRQISTLESALAASERELQRLRAELGDARADAAAAQRALDALTSSRAWRMSSPLRKGARALRGFSASAPRRVD